MTETTKEAPHLLTQAGATATTGGTPMAAPEAYRVCDCSDDPHVHFATVEGLRAYIARGPDLGLPIWVDELRVPDFDDTDQADLWLLDRDMRVANEDARERHLELHGHGGRI